MKTTLLISTMLVSSAAFATDWQTLINLAPNLKKETIALDSGGYIKADAVKLPSGQYRFLGFNTFLAAKRPVLTVEADGKDTNDLCQNAVFLDKKFKAQLVVQTNPLITNNKPLFGPDMNSFENPVTIGPAKITFDKKGAFWSVNDVDVISKSKGRLLTDYYEEIMSAQLQQSADGVLRMDLSKMNAFACDLMQGKLVFSVTRTAEYEPGMPSKETWLALDQFTSIFQSFWKLQPQVVDTRLSQNQNELAEAVTLGVVARSKVAVEEILKSPARLQKFLASVKMDTKGLNPIQKAAVRSTEVTDNWMQNTEFTKPAAATVKQNLTIGSDPVYSNFED